MDYQQYLEPIIKKYSTGDFYSELISAKNEYFEKTGMVTEEDIEYENRMNIFLDWYLFDRPLASFKVAPVSHYYSQMADKLTIEEADIYKGFCNTIHSIFYCLKIKKDEVVVEDLFQEKKYNVSHFEYKQAFMKGDIFEARLIPFKKEYIFYNGFCFHPVEMEKFIVSEIKKVKHQDKSEQTKLIQQLAAMKLKHSRYQHINIKHIYTFTPKF